MGRTKSVAAVAICALASLSFWGDVEAPGEVDNGQKIPASQLAFSQLPLSQALEVRSVGAPELKIVQPVAGAELTSPFEIVAESNNFTMVPAGDVREGTGHVHFIVDQPCVEPGIAIDNSPGTIHASRGELNTHVELEPGVHTICVQIGDGFHTAVAISDEVTFSVVASN